MALEFLLKELGEKTSQGSSRDSATEAEDDLEVPFDHGGRLAQAQVQFQPNEFGVCSMTAL